MNELTPLAKDGISELGVTEKPSETAPANEDLDESLPILSVADESMHTHAVREKDRTFKIAMSLAALIHAFFFLSLIQSKPRRIGNPNGSQDAISVSILSAKDLKSRATIEDESKPAPQAPPAPAQPEPPQPTPPAPPAPPEPVPPEAVPPLKPTTEAPPSPEKPVEEKKEVEAEKPEPATEEKKAEEHKAEEQKAEEQKAELQPPVPDFETTTEKSEEKLPEKKEETKPPEKVVDKALAELLKKTDPVLDDKKTADRERTADARSARPPKPQRQPVPDMSMPGGGAGVQRPPGYTRSGENDAFARGVIRALQRTMPQLRSTFGIVTVRIDLDRNGNLAKVTVLKPSGVAGLDQSVTFAVQQSSFPLPPVNATPADLTFFVRYVYN